MQKPKVIFFGNERLATGVSTTAPTLQALVTAGYPVAAVVSHNEATTSRKLRTLEIAEVAKAHTIPVLLPEKPALIIEQLQAYQAEVGVLAAYGKIVPQSVIDIFPHGIINIHPSLLPKHRGPTPLESVILKGETETGVSVMGLVKAMDGGPVYAQARVALTGSETKQELADKLLGLGSGMILEVLEQIFSGTAKPLPQDDDQATFDELINKEDGLLDFNKPALQLEREVRAYIEWPKSRTIIAGKEVVITLAHVEGGSGEPGQIWKDGKKFGFYTTDGIFVIDELKPAGKGIMSAEAFLAGYAI
jgi:methionyl-tRNA formyltransferase